MFDASHVPVLSGRSVGPPPEVHHRAAVPDARQRSVPSRRRTMVMIVLLLLMRDMVMLIFEGVVSPASRLAHPRPQVGRGTEALVRARAPRRRWMRLRGSKVDRELFLPRVGVGLPRRAIVVIVVLRLRPRPLVAGRRRHLEPGGGRLAQSRHRHLRDYPVAVHRFAS